MRQFILDNLIWLISVPITSLSTWIFITKPYQKKELKSKDIENESSHTDVINKNLDVYQRMFQDLDEQLLKATIKIKNLESEVDKIQLEYNILKIKCQENR